MLLEISHLARFSGRTDRQDRMNAEFSDVWTKKKRKVGLPQAATISPHTRILPMLVVFSGDQSVFLNPPRLLKSDCDIRPDQSCSCSTIRAYRALQKFCV
jgi:hypothetical protein